MFPRFLSSFSGVAGGGKDEDNWAGSGDIARDRLNGLGNLNVIGGWLGDAGGETGAGVEPSMLVLGLRVCAT